MRHGKILLALLLVASMMLPFAAGANAADDVTCVLGHTALDHESVTCDLPLLSWTQWTSTENLPTTTGNYRLTGDVTLKGQANYANAQNVVIDLNGHNVTSPARIALVNGNATLTITDTAQKQGTCTTTNTALNDTVKGGGLLYAHTGTLNIYGGNFDGTPITTQSTNKAPYCGSVMFVLAGGKVNILGGTLTGGFSWRGGTIYNQGQLYIGGNAVINGGNTTNMGAAIYNDTSVTLGGNSVLNCGTSTGGGCYGVIGGKITITDNATINRNSTSRVIMALNTLTKDVTISGNATINGQIQLTKTGNYYKSKLVIKDSPTFIIDQTNPALFIVAWNNDAQKSLLDLSGLTGGSGLTIRLPDGARTGEFGIGAQALMDENGVAKWFKSNDRNYTAIVNADNKLEMIKTEVNKNVLSATFVGDSITAGDGATAGNRYWELLEKQTHLQQVFGMGVNGSCYSTQSEFGTDHEPLVTRYDQIPDTDLIFIFMGTNDFGRATPMGTIADSEDISFYGAMNLVLTNIQAQHPDSQIILLTPINRFDKTENNLGLTLADYITAIKAVAQKYDLPVIDMNTLTADIFVEENRDELMKDTVHPNDAGHVYLAQAIQNWLETNDQVTYDVTFKNWDGSLLTTQKYTYGQQVQIPARPEREGYTFTGWDKEVTACQGKAIYTAQFKLDQLPGDFDGDGELTDADAIYLLWHVLFPETNKVQQNADVNNDGAISDADAIYLLWHVLFPENNPLYPA